MTYPPAPENIDPRIVKPTAAFQLEVVRTALAILLFASTYLLLLAGACVLTVVCTYWGIMIMVKFPKLITLLFGVGLVGFGLMLLFFLLKFMFNKNIADRSGFIEVFEEDQPVLFDFVSRLTRETGASFPKHIYLSHNVNASVFYDSSFWSMFGPVRKNLVIGLGFVNSVNMSEFKAVLAHEFGHFSQRSMKLGSYVYNVNQAIYNMLFDNRAYGNTLEELSSTSWVFALMAVVTVKMIQGIQFMLRGVYTVINRSYMALSRQMEFHADAVAASVSGSNHLVSALYRLELAQSTFEETLTHYTNLITDNKKGDNFYASHRYVLEFVARRNRLPLTGGLPDLSAHHHLFANQSRLVFKDQWASHPDNDVRAEKLNGYGLNTPTVYDSPWILFRNADALQGKFTEKLYEPVTPRKTFQIIGSEEFGEIYSRLSASSLFPEAYGGYYSQHHPLPAGAAPGDTPGDLPAHATFNVLFSEEQRTKLKQLGAIEHDLAALKQVIEGVVKIKTFEFKGRKHGKKDIPGVLQELHGEYNVLHADIRENDLNIYRFFKQLALSLGRQVEFLDHYDTYSEASRSMQAAYTRYEQLQQELAPVYNTGEMLWADVEKYCARAKQHETPIRSDLEQLLADPARRSYFNEGEIQLLKKFLEDKAPYTLHHSLNQPVLERMQSALQLYTYNYSEDFNRKKRTLLEFQLELLTQGGQWPSAV